MVDFAERVSRIGALADPLRRDLYLYVCAQSHPVGRDEAADALIVPRHKAKFHLDRLEEDGLLETEFARLSGRTGPGAGRPSKLYRRSEDDIAVSLPGREYELASRLLAEAVSISGRTGEPAIEVLHHEAARCGREWGQHALADTTSPDPLDVIRTVLADHGYEPRQEDGQIVLANCPFHALATTHTDMVCGMNLALIDALVDEVGPGATRCQLDPRNGRCCVVLSADDPQPLDLDS